SKASILAYRLGQIVHHSKVGLKDRLDHQLGNAFTALQVNGLCWIEIYQRNFDLTSIIGIYSSWRIHYTKPATYCKTRTGMDKTCKALGNSNGDTSRHQQAFACSKNNINRCTQVCSGITR